MVQPSSAPSAMWRWAAAGAVSFGLVGAVVGLVLGLRSFPPTAWAATLEVALPAAILGALVGCAAQALTAPVRPHVRRR